MSGFDGHFVVWMFADRGYNITNYVHCGSKIRSIQVEIGKNRFVRFKDSLKFMLGDLRQLCKVYQVEQPKEYFPFDYLNHDNVKSREYDGPMIDKKQV